MLFSRLDSVCCWQRVTREKTVNEEKAPGGKRHTMNLLPKGLTHISGNISLGGKCKRQSCGTATDFRSKSGRKLRAAARQTFNWLFFDLVSALSGINFFSCNRVSCVEKCPRKTKINELITTHSGPTAAKNTSPYFSTTK